MNEMLGLLAPILSSALGGTAVVATRWASASLEQLTLATLRYAIGAVCLLPLAVSAVYGGPPRTYVPGSGYMTPGQQRAAEVRARLAAQAEARHAADQARRAAAAQQPPAAPRHGFGTWATRNNPPVDPNAPPHPLFGHPPSGSWSDPRVRQNAGAAAMFLFNGWCQQIDEDGGFLGHAARVEREREEAREQERRDCFNGVRNPHLC